MLKTPAEPRVDAGGQVQLLLLDDGGVHIKLDSAGKRVDEGEKEEWLQGEHQLGLRKKSHCHCH